VRRTLTPKPATASSHMVNSLQLDLSASNHPLGDSLRGHWLARSAMGVAPGQHRTERPRKSRRRQNARNKRIFIAP
jgi:hypothetical protein